MQISQSQIGQNIRDMRKIRGVSQRDLAWRMWGDPERRTYISALEAGRHGFTVEVLQQVAMALQCSAMDLQGIAPFTLEPEPQQEPA